MAQPRPAAKGQAAQRPNENARPVQEANEPVPIRIVENTDQTFHEQDREAKTDQHDSEDLEAQKRSATATEEQVIPAWAAALFGFAGTALIAWTMWETRRYNRLQLRAYVSYKIEVLEGGLSEGFLKVRETYTNTGQTPATALRIARCYNLGPHDPPEEFFEFDLPREVDQSAASLGGGLESGGRRDLRFTPPEALQIAAGALEMFVFGAAHYRDIYGTEHCTKFRVHLYAKGGLAHFYAMSRGNEMT
jgi:hypothetical protein